MVQAPHVRIYCSPLFSSLFTFFKIMFQMNVCDARDCVLVPVAGPGALHLKHQVLFHWTAVNPALAGRRRLQLWAQKPHLVQYRGEELMSILQIDTQ